MGVCPSCGVPSHPGDRFCSQCGTALASGPSEAEYRFVTILCTDLSGFSELSERLDGEDLKACMGELMHEITRIIRSFGGEVEKYIGDAVVAIFGNRRSCEDDPVRAILAAKRIHSRVAGMGAGLDLPESIRLSMHTGINTGEVLVDAGESALSSHGTLGRPINIASRLCALAARDEVLIGESLVAEAMRFFHVEWMGKKMLKGFKNPVCVYRVLQERKEPVAVHRFGGVTSVLVGREHELSVLKDTARSLESGRGGGVICIEGDAGVGKSRLIEEFRRSVHGRCAFASVFCYDRASSTPYFPFLRLVRLVTAGNTEADDLHVSRAISRLDLPEEHARQVRAFCAGDWHDQGTVRVCVKERTADALLALISAAAGKGPSVFCLEDIHWADQSTLDLLQYLSHAWERHCPCMLLFSRRPGGDPPLPGRLLELKELSDSEVGRMIGLMLDSAAIPVETLRCLADATGGNPFYVEEVVNYLLEKGMELSGRGGLNIPEDIPSTLYGLISSRLDHLGASSRRILKEASMLGRVFSGELLSAVCSRQDALPAGLCDAVQCGFIHALGGDTYMFRHDITRDVAGRTLLKRERVVLHKRIARTLEDRRGPRDGQSAAELAHHYALAREFEKAIRYREEAAGHCLASGAWVEAATHYQAAARLLAEAKGIPDAPGRLAAVHEGMWMCSRVFNPSLAGDALDALAEHYRLSGMKGAEAFTVIRRINLLSQRGFFNEAIRSYEYALGLAGDDQVLKAAARTAVAYTYTFLGRPLTALALLDEARPSLEDADTFLLAVNIVSTLAACVWKGDLAGAHHWYGRIKAFSMSLLDIDLLADMWFAHICCLEGSFDRAKGMYEEVSARERKLGRLAGGLSYLRIQGSVYFRSRYFGDVKGALSDLEQFEGIRTGIHDADSLKRLYDAWIALEEGKALLAKDLLENALPGLRSGVANRVPYALNALAEAMLSLGDVDAARRCVQESIAWTEDSGNADQLAWALRIAADISVRQGATRDALRDLRRAYRIARSCRMKPHLAWLLASWGGLFSSEGEAHKAKTAYERSILLWKSMGNRHQARKVRQALRLLGD